MEHDGCWRGFTSLAIWFGAGAVAAAFALSFLLLGIAQGFAVLVYVTMAVVLGIVAFVGIQMGRSRARTVSAIPQTVESLKETKE